jgi:nicotinamide-nucleotide amidase
MTVLGDVELTALAQRVGGRLAAAGLRISTAESCTGGWIAKTLTDVPGSSAWFGTGLVCYSNDAKITLLGVAASDLAEHGAVSESVVRAMARGALERAPADVAVAVSGIAGPDGGTAAKPVGTVWIGWAWRTGTGVQVAARAHLFAGDRDAVRRQAVAAALEGALAE